MHDNKWYVVTGGPAVGKSTLLDELAKKGYKTLPEAARVVIDEGIAKGLTIEQIRSNEQEFQNEVLERKVITEKEMPNSNLTFFDRGMHDTLAYLTLHGMPLVQKVLDAVENANYKKVFLLEPLKVFEKDYARTESEEEARKLYELLRKSYADYGMEPIVVPVLPPAERAEFVLQHIE